MESVHLLDAGGVSIAAGKSPSLTSSQLLEVRTEKSAAEITVSGRVTDAATNEALAGCTVVVKGTQRGPTTDANGNYKIVVPDGNRGDVPAVLVYGFIGFVSQEITVANRSTINVALSGSASELAQVVVVGYGSTAKKDVTGSASILT